jgi:aminoglycoside phosphotransferase (APT) family kinase protein
MEDRGWRKYLRKYGIQVQQLTPVRDWSESRVIRVECTLRGKPAVKYLKLCLSDRDTESAVYRFAGHLPSFPAPGATALMVEGEEWLLLDQAEGKLLADIADIAGADALNTYITAARRIARFHRQAVEEGWTSGISDIEILKERVEALPDSVLNDLRESVAKGRYSGVDPSLISLIETASARWWPELAEEFKSYHDSLIHGDCHYGNLFLTPEDGICLIDWGSASVAPGLMDLAALVDVTQRMGEHDIHESDLLDAYLDELSKPEREAYGNPERAWDVCRTVRAFMELEWFASTGDDYGQRVQRELTLLCSFLHI